MAVDLPPLSVSEVISPLAAAAPLAVSSPRTFVTDESKEARRVQAADRDREGTTRRIGPVGDGRESTYSIHSVGVPNTFLPGLNDEHTHTFAAVAYTNDGEQNRISASEWLYLAPLSVQSTDNRVTFAFRGDVGQLLAFYHSAEPLPAFII
jgi:hypothetical protein